MGATVSTAKMAAAFKANDGTVGYVLFEQTYEKNCYPHAPKWGCLAIGNRAEVLRVILGCAAAFEDGCLKVRTNERSTEGYIGAWFEELATPFDFPNRDVELRMGSDRQATIAATDIYNKDRTQDILGVLLGAGFADQASTLAKGEPLTVNLYKDFDLLRTLFSAQAGKNIGQCAAWGLLSHKDVGQTLARTLGMSKGKPSAHPTLVLPEMQKLQSPNRSVDTLLVRQAAGHWEICWRSYVDVAIATTVAEAEIKRAGSYDANIKAVRQAVKSAPLASAATKVDFDPAWIPAESMGWMPSDYNEMAIAYGEEPGKRFSTTWKDIVAKDDAATWSLAWKMTRLPCSRWYPGQTGLIAQNDAHALEAA